MLLSHLHTSAVVPSKFGAKVFFNSAAIQMEQRVDGMRERSRRPIRNKRHSRRAFGEDRRPPKRLFTPEIKRFLKDWLVRRRDNPYPNRDEKKTLALQTGLTYVQVCNWFANWRRKLKNAGKEPQKQTWGNLIKTYNTQVKGNVEHFSICSEDSIWQELETSSNYDHSDHIYETHLDLYSSQHHDKTYQYKSSSIDHSYTNVDEQLEQNQDQCFYVSSTTENDVEPNSFALNTNKYKNHIIEKYLRDCQKPENQISDENAGCETDSKPSMISRWLESAVNFKPNENNYLHWTLSKSQKKKMPKRNEVDMNSYNQQHGREELDAAEALTRLAQAFARRN